MDPIPLLSSRMINKGRPRLSLSLARPAPWPAPWLAGLQATYFIQDLLELSSNHFLVKTGRRLSCGVRV